MTTKNLTKKQTELLRDLDAGELSFWAGAEIDDLVERGIIEVTATETQGADTLVTVRRIGHGAENASSNNQNL